MRLAWSWTVLLLLLLLRHATTTPAAADDAVQLPTDDVRVAFISCNLQTLPESVLWAPLRRFDPHLLVWGGDNVYGDPQARASGFHARKVSTKASIDDLRVAYAQLKAIKGYQTLLQSPSLVKPVLATWDDHDFGSDDGDGTYAGKHESKELFLREMVQAPPTDPRWKRSGVYDARTFSTPSGRRLRVVLLDVRFNKDPWAMEPNGAMLGEEQWAWLEKELCGDRSPSANLIVSGLQVLMEDRAWGESWSRFPRERARLLDVMGKCKVRGAVLLSGDVHMSESFEATCGSDLVAEITSSGLTHAFLKSPVTWLKQYSFVETWLGSLMAFAQNVLPWRYKTGYYLDVNALTIGVQLSPTGEETISLNVIGAGGETKLSRTYALKQLDRTQVAPCGPRAGWGPLYRVRMFLARAALVAVYVLVPLGAIAGTFGVALVALVRAVFSSLSGGSGKVKAL